LYAAGECGVAGFAAGGNGQAEARKNAQKRLKTEEKVYRRVNGLILHLIDYMLVAHF
jgi:hypothetical protein